MSTLIKKEIRLLLPALVGALALAILPNCLLLTDSSNHGFLPSHIFLIGAVLLPISSFGREFGLNTLPFMMAQPVERARIWRAKIAVLAIFLAVAYAVWFISSCFCYFVRPSFSLPAEVLLWITLSVPVLAAGGLWMTLLVRQTVAACLLTLLIPIAVSAVVKIFGGADWMIYAALGLYAAAGTFLARRQFLRLQDTAWTGGVIFFGIARVAEGCTARERRPWAALLRKELQLQQVTLIGMASLLVLHLGVIFLRTQGAHVLSRTARMILEGFGFLWAVVPMLAGSLIVAEERQCGTFDSLLCLPVSRRIQFAIKLFFALVLGLLSAAALCRIEMLGGKVDVGVTEHIPLVFFCFLALSLLGVYASTLTRGLVPALAAGVVATMLLWSIGPIAALYSGRHLWPLLAAITLPPTLLWLAYGNFRYVFESGRRWRRNTLYLTALFVLVNVSAAAIYHRAWEWAVPLEYPHGPAKLPTHKPSVFRGDDSIGLAAVLPDGRLWFDRTTLDEQGRQRPGVTCFAAGSNWLDVCQTDFLTVGLRSDGTLWVSEEPHWTNGIRQAPMVQFGVETNWQSMAGGSSGGSKYLLRRDGTLWYWWINYRDVMKDSGLLSFEPHQMGTESNWVKIIKGQRGTFAWKKDGSAWVLNVRADREYLDPKNRPTFEIPGVMAVPDLDHIQFKSMNLYQTFPQVELGVREDGTLWYWNWIGVGDPKSKWIKTALPRLVQIGKNSDWAAVVSGRYRLLGLKTDGSIWKLSGIRTYVVADRLRHGPVGIQVYGTSFDGLQDAPVRLGTHNDWIGLCDWQDGSVFLSADGTIWRWSQNDWPWKIENAFLAPSRRPTKIENILGAHK